MRFITFLFFVMGKTIKRLRLTQKYVTHLGIIIDFIDADILYSKYIFVLIESITMFEAELLIITNGLNQMLNNYESTFIEQKYF